MRRLGIGGVLGAAILLAGVVSALDERVAAAQTGGNFGLGLMVGEPSGVCGKLYLNKRNAVDGAVGLGFVGGRGIHAHADYLWHPFLLTRAPSFDMPLYVGIGGRLHQHSGDGGHIHLGPRGVVGILFGFKTAPIDIFIEAAVGVDLIANDDHKHNGGVTIDLAVGIRYYF